MGVGTCLPRDALRKIGSVGLPAAHRTMRLVAADGSLVGPGEVGEFIAGGPGLMRGYSRDPAGTAACLENGLFRTGDLGSATQRAPGWLRAEGNDHLQQPKSPLPKSRTFSRRADIAEAAVVGQPDGNGARCLWPSS